MHLSQFIKSKWQRKIIRVTAVLIVLLFVYNVFLFPALLGMGATKAEFNRSMPGDELVTSKDYKNTLAITVEKSPSAIWPWIAQMGVDKAGFYSYTWLENMFGCELKNADKIHPEWQNPQEGYYEGVCKSAMDKNMPGWRIAIVEPDKSFVWKGEQGEWMMGVYIDSIDANTSRLITRMLYKSPEKFTSSWWLDKVWFEWAHCLMQRGMIRGIRRRAEQL
jgi:hypothetical protein